MKLEASQYQRDTGRNRAVCISLFDMLHIAVGRVKQLKEELADVNGIL